VHLGAAHDSCQQVKRHREAQEQPV
jgi:hypothetical protein